MLSIRFNMWQLDGLELGACSWYRCLLDNYNPLSQTSKCHSTTSLYLDFKTCHAVHLDSLWSGVFNDSSLMWHCFCFSFRYIKLFMVLGLIPIPSIKHILLTYFMGTELLIGTLRQWRRQTFIFSWRLT